MGTTEEGEREGPLAESQTIIGAKNIEEYGINREETHTERDDAPRSFGSEQPTVSGKGKHVAPGLDFSGCLRQFQSTLSPLRWLMEPPFLRCGPVKYGVWAREWQSVR